MLHRFWETQYDQITRQESDYKAYQLPLARIKKIMRIEEDVKMISGEAPIIFSKACELFVLELTLRSWCFTEHDNRRTLQRSDVANAVSQSEMYDFLVDVIPRSERGMLKGAVVDEGSEFEAAAELNDLSEEGSEVHEE